MSAFCEDAQKQKADLYDIADYGEISDFFEEIFKKDLTYVLIRVIIYM